MAAENRDKVYSVTYKAETGFSLFLFCVGQPKE